jgi:hypothetical protein
MKTPKEWAEEIRNALSHGLRYDPVLTSGETLIEEMVGKIQEEALAELPGAKTGVRDYDYGRVFGAHGTTGGI